MASRRDNRSCIISGCVNKGSKGFFRFPSEKNPEQRKAWLKICGLEDVNINDKICSIHFNKYDFFPRRNENQIKTLILVFFVKFLNNINEKLLIAKGIKFWKLTTSN